MRTYRIEVYTPPYGPGTAAGTGATMYVTLYGTRASSDELPVGAPGGQFGQTGLDTLTTHLADLGQITRVHVRHDNAGLEPGWFLDRVVVADDAGGRWTFPCQRWLARHRDDGAIERVLDAA